jgi:DNA-binding transcriptional LysR family regulator
MRLKQIEVFNAVMLTGSVNGAAKILNVTQPAVSRVIQHAEVQLGFALFRRVKGRLVPTREALILNPEVEKLYSQLSSVQRLALALKEGAEDVLRVQCVPALAYEVMPDAIALFRKRFKTLPCAITTLHSRQIVSSLAMREADVGFLFGAHNHPALESDTVCDAELLLATQPGVLARDQGVAFDTLSRLPLIELDGDDPLGILINEALPPQATGNRSGITVQTYQMALGMVKKGLGSAIVDPFTALTAEPASIELHRLRPVFTVPVQALWTSEGNVSHAILHFVECVREVALTANRRHRSAD